MIRGLCRRDVQSEMKVDRFNDAAGSFVGNAPSALRKLLLQ